MVTAIYELLLFLKTLSIKLKMLSAEEFYALLVTCDHEQRIYAIWLRYYV